MSSNYDLLMLDISDLKSLINFENNNLTTERTKKLFQGTLENLKDNFENYLLEKELNFKQ